MSFVHNKDGSTRYFKCDFNKGCSRITLTADVINSKVHLHCNCCGFTKVVDNSIALTNQSGSASFIGNIPGGRGL